MISNTTFSTFRDKCIKKIKINKQQQNKFVEAEAVHAFATTCRFNVNN